MSYDFNLAYDQILQLKATNDMYTLKANYFVSVSALPPVDLCLNFEKKIKLEKSSLRNWSFSLQKSISKLIFAD